LSIKEGVYYSLYDKISPTEEKFYYYVRLRDDEAEPAVGGMDSAESAGGPALKAGFG